MGDSSMFFHWAMETLQHEQLQSLQLQQRQQELRAADSWSSGDSARPQNTPGPGGALMIMENHGCSGSGLHNGTAPAQDSSWSSGDSGRRRTTAVVEKEDGWSPNCSVGSTAYPPVTVGRRYFTSALAQEATPSPATAPAGAPAPASGKRSLEGADGTATEHSSPELCVQGHVMAERKRREKINRRFIELSSIIPGLKKMDKATILSDAARYLREQQEKIKELEGRNVRSIGSVSVRPCIAAIPDGATTTRSSLPQIDARISESNVMVRIHCEDGKGLLVRLLAEVARLHLSITNTNVMPFSACTLHITIMAKVDHGFNITAEDIVGRLDTVLH